MYIALPASAGFFANQYTYIESKYKTAFINMKQNDNYMLWQAAASWGMITCLTVLLLFLLFAIALDQTLNQFPSEIKLTVYVFFWLGWFFSITLLYKGITKIFSFLYKDWKGNFVVIAIITFLNSISSSYTNKIVEEITGYSSINFHSLEAMQWLISVAFLLLIFMFLSFAFGFHIFLRETFYLKNEKCELKKYLHRNFIGNGYLLSMAFIFISNSITINTYMDNLDNLFTNAFVELNYRNSNIECIKKHRTDLDNVKSAYIIKNKLSKNNLSIAIRVNHKWTFEKLYCNEKTDIVAAQLKRYKK